MNITIQHRVFRVETPGELLALMFYVSHPEWSEFCKLYEVDK